jgi:AhpD family alkylhydroperoxidase
MIEAIRRASMKAAVPPAHHLFQLISGDVMTANVRVPTESELDPKVAKISEAWKAIGSDPSMVRLLNYRADLIPPFFDFYLKMRDDGLLSARIKEMARFQIANLNGCMYCLASLSTLAEKQGITDAHIAEMSHRPPGLYTDQELAAMDLAKGLWTDAQGAGKDKALLDRLHAHFSDAELVELVWALAMYIGLGKMVVFFALDRDQ